MKRFDRKAAIIWLLKNQRLWEGIYDLLDDVVSVEGNNWERRTALAEIMRDAGIYSQTSHITDIIRGQNRLLNEARKVRRGESSQLIRPAVKRAKSV